MSAVSFGRNFAREYVPIPSLRRLRHSISSQLATGKQSSKCVPPTIAESHWIEFVEFYFYFRAVQGIFGNAFDVFSMCVVREFN